MMETHEANETQLKAALDTADNLRQSIDPMPAWAQQVRQAMPDWGFEIHCMRWLDGLDLILRSIQDQTHYSGPFGRYGDRPGVLFGGVEKRAAIVTAWLETDVMPASEPGKHIFTWLGQPDEKKRQAAQCFVELTQAFVEDPDPEGPVKTLGESWRARTSDNDILQAMFQGEGLDRGLFSGASYWTLHRLDTVLRIMGGDLSGLDDIRGSCNWDLRNVFQVDPSRLQVTLGYLWGAAAYLDGQDVIWLRANQPDIAGAGIFAYKNLAVSGAAPEIVRWLASVFLVTTRFWYQRALIIAKKAGMPAFLFEVPSLPEKIEALTSD